MILLPGDVFSNGEYAYLCVGQDPCRPYGKHPSVECIVIGIPSKNGDGKIKPTEDVGQSWSTPTSGFSIAKSVSFEISQEWTGIQAIWLRQDGKWVEIIGVIKRFCHGRRVVEEAWDMDGRMIKEWIIPNKVWYQVFAKFGPIRFAGHPAGSLA